MCNFASFICTKDKIFWSKTNDSNQKIIIDRIGNNPKIIIAKTTKTKKTKS